MTGRATSHAPILPAPHRFRPVGITGSILGAIVVPLLLRVSGLQRGVPRV